MAEPDDRDRGGRLYLEDFHVGQRFTSATHVMDAEEIKAFARQFDPQPFHLDEAAAKETFFGGLVASGWHTAAVTMRLQVESGLPIAGGMIGIGGEMSWPRPTRPGDILRVVSEILEVTPSRSRPDRGAVRARSETRNQRDEVVQILDARLLVPRRAEPGAGARA
ncbi:MAG TPA: MaoC family dehydratase [Xanthobacteraceae bacterium]|jgi:acyl dehydratase